MKVFLGGTCNGSDWRESLIPMLRCDYFNPVVDDWNEAAQANERHERETCDVCLYVLTPRMTGVYAVAEAVDDSNKRPERTVLCVLADDAGQTWLIHQAKSLIQVMGLVERNGAVALPTLERVASYLNNRTE